MGVKAGDIIRIDDASGAYLKYHEFEKKYISEEVAIYDDQEKFHEELEGKLARVLSVVPHLETNKPIAIVYVQEIEKVVCMDVEGGFMSMVQPSEPEDVVFLEQEEITDVREEVKPNTISEELLRSKIVGESYSRMGVKTTICVLTMKNGFEVVGESACVDPANFDYELGKKYAYENAFNKLWQLEGYVLQSNLKK